MTKRKFLTIETPTKLTEFKRIVSLSVIPDFTVTNVFKFIKFLITLFVINFYCK